MARRRVLLRALAARVGRPGGDARSAQLPLRLQEAEARRYLYPRSDRVEVYPDVAKEDPAA